MSGIISQIEQLDDNELVAAFEAILNRLELNALQRERALEMVEIKHDWLMLAGHEKYVGEFMEWEGI